MAFTKTPTKDTYSSETLPLAVDFSVMAGPSVNPVTESGMINIIPYKDHEGPLYGKTRRALDTNLVVTGNNYSIRGMYVWEVQIGTYYHFMVVGNGTDTLIYTSIDKTTWTNVNTIVGETQRTPVRFAEFISATNTKSLVMVTGITGIVFTSNLAGTVIVDGDFPTPHVPFPVFLNGRLHLAKANTGDIYCSDLNDPSAWTAGNFISSEVYPDDIKALLNIDNYILAIGQSGSEFFYDAAKASGSPLQRLEGGLLPFGTTFPNSVAYNRNAACLIGNTSDGEASLIAVEGLKFKTISSKDVLTIFYTQVKTGNPGAAQVKGMFFREAGELYYILQSNGEITAGTADSTFLTWVYCFSTDMWVKFTVRDGVTTFPVYATANGPSNVPLSFVGSAIDGKVGFGYFDPSRVSVTDLLAGTTYHLYQEIILPPVNFGTLNRKTMSRLGLDYQRKDDATSAPIIVRVRDGHDNTVTQTHTLSGNWSSGDGGFPFVTQLGSFRDRSFHISSTGSADTPNAYTRWDSMEVFINKGQR